MLNFTPARKKKHVSVKSLIKVKVTNFVILLKNTFNETEKTRLLYYYAVIFWKKRHFCEYIVIGSWNEYLLESVAEIPQTITQCFR